ncbi:hypothetical protein [Paenibacillus hexagrammi]|uniref:STAS/SEC14 domain-containing protein n=1 Tax=Paenibacillus hexagrammi TaxID=2908839 RepID=A0ABY3SNJ6_9BACL|nr:hypothetical protein [Paenibacillus sp. YPD9-1]UJF35493.1 hypothetical protein L0M14_10540 [Paenibacillus sp. YPD9-1]
MSEEHYTIFHNDPYNYVVLKRNNFVSKEVFQASTNKSLQLLKQHHAAKLIIDDSLIKFVTPVNQEWILDEFSNTAFTSGVRFLAIVTPETLIGKYTVDKIYEQAPVRTTTSIEVRSFSHIDEAESWIREKNRRRDLLDSLGSGTPARVSFHMIVYP